MSRWEIVAASDVGTRTINEDSVSHDTFKERKRRYYALAISDGVGSKPGSGACAAQATNIALSAVQQFVKDRNSRRPLDSSDSEHLVRHLTAAFKSIGGPPTHAATFAGAVFTDRSGVAAWAGDSRLYVLSRAGTFRQLTSDHQDSMGKLTHYLRGDGSIEGGLDTSVFDLSDAIAVVATSDGVHAACSHEELRQFVWYCIATNTRSTSSLSSELRGFLEGNISDNASLVIAYQFAYWRLVSRRLSGMRGNR